MRFRNACYIGQSDRPQQDRNLDRRSALGGLRVAIGFLTRIPVGCAHDSDLRAAFWAFPLVGGAVGLVGGAVYAASLLVGLPLVAAVIFALMAMALLTGALHEDGLADMADGFGGGNDRATKLAIMRDSRIGTYGVLTLGLVIGLKVTLLTHIGARTPEIMTVVAALAVAGVLSRAAMLLIPVVLDPAQTDGLGAALGRPRFVLVIVPVGLAMAILLLALFRFGWTPIFWSLVAASGGIGAVAVLAVRQVGGYTGDVLGAAQQISETAILVALAATMTGASS